MRQIYELGKNGLVKIETPANSIVNNLPVGYVLLWGGNQAWRSQEYVVTGRTENDWGINYSLISLETYGKSSTEAHGIKSKDDKNVWHSQHFFLTDKILSPSEVLDLVEKNKIKEFHDKEAAELEVMRKGQEKEKHEKDNPDLVTIKNGGSATKNIKKELKKAFPSVKFSVRHKSFAGGDSIDITWTDGATTEQVDKITDKYQEGHFDGMNDIYEYDNRETWTDVFGGAKYVSTQRDLSAKAYIYAAYLFCKDWGYKMPKFTIDKSYKGGFTAWVKDSDDIRFDSLKHGSCWSLSQAINHHAHSMDFQSFKQEVA